jgi:hypothetical protein
MIALAGYSGTPLAQKLGLRDGQRVLFVDLPEELDALKNSRHFAEVRKARWADWRGSSRWDFVQGFTASRAVLEHSARPFMEAIVPDGTIWISWPKKASRVPTDITEDVIRDIVLPIGLVDVKVAAVSDVWSGLKLVIRKASQGK